MESKPVFDYPRVQISLSQLTELKRVCYERKPKVIVEIGSWLGQSTAVFGGYACNNNANVIAIDWWEDNPDVSLYAHAEVDIYRQFLDNMRYMGVDRNVCALKMRSEDAVS